MAPPHSVAPPLRGYIIGGSNKALHLPTGIRCVCVSLNSATWCQKRSRQQRRNARSPARPLARLGSLARHGRHGYASYAAGDKA